MAPPIGDLVDDLLAEHADLASVLSSCPAEAWDTATPAEGWLVRDQITHLAWFDALARTAITDPEALQAEAETLLARRDTYMSEVNEFGRDVPGPALLGWWTDERRSLAAAARAADPARRVPWFGPPMSLASKLTARIMETWAHGQDVRDALGRPPAATDRLAHVVHIGVGARPYSYLVRGMDAPDTPIRVDVVLPSGRRLQLGDPGAADRVEGTALDLALVVTQRRHLDDTDLTCSGPGARQWLLIAQAFAGPPGAGRPPTGRRPAGGNAGGTA